MKLNEKDCERWEGDLDDVQRRAATPCLVKVARDLAAAVYGSPIISLFVADTRHSADMLMSYRTVRYITLHNTRTGR